MSNDYYFVEFYVCVVAILVCKVKGFLSSFMYYAITLLKCVVHSRISYMTYIPKLFHFRPLIHRIAKLFSTILEIHCRHPLEMNTLQGCGRFRPLKE